MKVKSDPYSDFSLENDSLTGIFDILTLTVIFGRLKSGGVIGVADYAITPKNSTNYAITPKNSVNYAITPKIWTKYAMVQISSQYDPNTEINSLN